MRAIRPEVVKKIVQMYRDGEKIEYIALTFDVSMGAVCRFAQVAGLSRGRGGGKKPVVVEA